MQVSITFHVVRGEVIITVDIDYFTVVSFVIFVWAKWRRRRGNGMGVNLVGVIND